MNAMDSTYAKFEDNNDGENCPDRVAAELLDGLLEEDQQGNKRESETHLR